MPSQIEARLERLENSAGSSRVVVVFEGDGQSVPEGATVIVVRLVKSGDRHDDQASTH